MSLLLKLIVGLQYGACYAGALFAEYDIWDFGIESYLRITNFTVFNDEVKYSTSAVAPRVQPHCYRSRIQSYHLRVLRLYWHWQHKMFFLVTLALSQVTLWNKFV